jgi:Xaa-Pro aminopeptidase
VFTTASWWASVNSALQIVGKRLQPVDDLVGRIWPSSERPKESQQPIVKHETVYAGEDVGQKLLRLTTELNRVGATATVINALDEVAWQFNLRGADIPYNPFFKSYAIIYADDRQPKLFVNLAQLNHSIYPVGVQVFDYSTFWSFLNETAADSTIKKIWISARVSQAIFGSIPDNKSPTSLMNSLVQRIKARKNPVERQGMRVCQIRDAVARMKHIGWIEQQLNNRISVNETQAVDQLLVYQKQQDKFQFPSFGAISASGEKAAIVHYSPKPATARPITKDQVYLLDVSELYRDVQIMKSLFFKGW